MSQRLVSPPLVGLDAGVNSLIGICRRRSSIVESFKGEAAAIDAMAPEFLELSDYQLQERLLDLRKVFHRGARKGEAVVQTALAAIREAADRQLGMRPFQVQLMGALALHRGFLAEMATGEGKTLTAALAAILWGWTKRPCHVVTVNDYLVVRDTERLTSLYHFCGVRVGCVIAEMDEAQRRKNYECDVTYVTGKELLSDFLRDRLRLGKVTHPGRRLIRQMLSGSGNQQGTVLRGLHSAIVDEADSVLIDEAVTPLIISAPRPNAPLKEATVMARDLIQSFQPGEDYVIDARHREIELTAAGAEKLIQKSRELPGFWQGPDRRLELAIQALVAREFYQRGRQYVVENGKLVIVDEFTGRPMPQRFWREGMHQAIEAKEGLEISDPAETVAKLSFQRFFRLFTRISGMTGTASEAAGEFWQVYGLPVMKIPTNRPCIREQWPDRFFVSEEDKWAAIVCEVERIHATGRPVLVGTRSVSASERLFQALTERGLEPRLLNATRLKEEAEIIALAGERGRVTIATNMAGRGTDIRLGNGVAALGGLHVIATERHESGRVDRQLFGRSGRQGDPGSAQAFISLEDELFRRYLPQSFRKSAVSLSKSKHFDRPVGRRAIYAAQRRAEKAAERTRKSILRADLWQEESLSFAGG